MEQPISKFAANGCDVSICPDFEARMAAEALTVPPSRVELIEMAYAALCTRLATTENVFLDEDEQRTYEALRTFLKN